MSMGNLKVGDRVFWKFGRNKRCRGHVGIVLAIVPASTEVSETQIAQTLKQAGFDFPFPSLSRYDRILIQGRGKSEGMLFCPAASTVQAHAKRQEAA